MSYTIGPGTVKVTVLQGKNLAPKDPNGKADPYCLFGFWQPGKPTNLAHKTKYKKATLNPIWYADKDASEKTFTLKAPIADPFHLELWDYDTVGDPDYMGEVEVPLEQFIRHPVQRFSDNLQKAPAYKGKVTGSIIFVWEYKADPAVKEAEDALRSKFLSDDPPPPSSVVPPPTADQVRKEKSNQRPAAKAVAVQEPARDAPPPGPAPVEGNVVTHNEKQDEIRHAALLGDAAAAFGLGALYAKGSEEHSIGQNDKEALKYYMMAADAGHAEAQFKVGLYLQMGYGTGTGSGPDDTSGPPNIPRALLWYEKAVAQNQPDAMNALAEMYESGWGVDVDMQKAIELYQRAESFGEKDCLAALGRIFKEQKTEDGYTKALAYLLKAVEHNEEDTEAFFHIAELYENGWGVAADKNKAIEYYKKAAEFDDVEDATEALKRLGVSDE